MLRLDGRALKRIDDDWFVQRFTPRRPQSTWSKVNRQKVEALIAAGRMRPASLAQIERAKADGRWEAAYDGMATSTVPEDLAAALEAAGLTDAFAELSRQNRYAILHRVQIGKGRDTRAQDREVRRDARGRRDALLAPLVRRARPQVARERQRAQTEPGWLILRGGRGADRGAGWIL